MERLLFILIVLMIASAAINIVSHHTGFLMGLVVGFLAAKSFK